MGGKKGERNEGRYKEKEDGGRREGWKEQGGRDRKREGRREERRKEEKKEEEGSGKKEGKNISAWHSGQPTELPLHSPVGI
ncbi:hypothetical protein L345_04723, partial [Ophiophagus hannah]